MADKLVPQNRVVNTQSYVAPYIGVLGDSSFYLASDSTFPTVAVKWGMIMGLDNNDRLVPATVSTGEPVQSRLVIFASQNGYSDVIPADPIALYNVALPTKTWKILSSAVYCQSGNSDDLAVLLNAMKAELLTINGVDYYSI